MGHDKPRVPSAENPEQVEESSGNVFADIGIANPEEMLAKAELARRICEIIAERKLTQAKAAVVLAIDRVEIAMLMRGRLDRFSIDRLFRFLNALGRDVEIVIRRASQARKAAMRVITA
jgi:predicted XRE-type DNA-binding protein